MTEENGRDFEKAEDREPKVSVILCFYNEERYLPEALDSILSQTYRNLEVVVINDGSTDGSEAVVRKYMEKDERIIYRSHTPNHGLAYARNRGLETATGEFAGFFDADDRMLPDKTEKEVRFLLEHPDIDVVGGSFYYMDAEGNVQNEPLKLQCFSDEEIRAFMLYRNAIAVGSALFRRKIITDNGASLDEKNRASEDYGLWIGLLPKIRLANLNEPVYEYRINHGSKAEGKAKKDPEAFVAEKKRILRKAWAESGFLTDENDIDVIYGYIHESRRILSIKDFIQYHRTFGRLRKQAEAIKTGSPGRRAERILSCVLFYYKRLHHQAYHLYWIADKLFHFKNP